MSNTPFVESLSSDPVEQVIARKVQRILNDPSLDRQAREKLVRKAQRELLAHRSRIKQREQLLAKVAAVKLPKGYQAQSVAICDGQIQVGSLNRKHGFVWLDAGSAPTGAAANEAAFRVPRPPKSGRPARKDLAQAIAERRKALGLNRKP